VQLDSAENLELQYGRNGSPALHEDDATIRWHAVGPQFEPKSTEKTCVSHVSGGPVTGK